jgi:hypothetical protein
MNEAGAISDLRRNGIKIEEKLISVPRYTGLKLWSVIEYLCHYCGYRWIKAWR